MRHKLKYFDRLAVRRWLGMLDILKSGLFLQTAYQKMSANSAVLYLSTESMDCCLTDSLQLTERLRPLDNNGSFSKPSLVVDATKIENLLCIGSLAQNRF